MFFDHIEQLKQQFTDQWVVVDASRPELKRFAGHNGRVKTVNMSGRALVEFDAYENIGWYDIDASYLTIVDAPVAQAASTTASPKKPAAKPAAKSAPSAAKASRPAGGGMSVADIMAAARGGGGGAPAAKTAAPTEAKKPAPEKKGPGTKAPLQGGPQSVADILAAARSQVAPSPSVAEKLAVDSTPQTEAAAAVPEPPESATPAATVGASPSAATKPLPTDVAAIVAMCREMDSD